MINNLAEAKDLFDEVAEERDVFAETKSSEEEAFETTAADLVKKLESLTDKQHKKDRRIIADELKAYIDEKLLKVKPVQNVIERVIEKKIIQPEVFHVEPKIVEAPPQIIKEVRVEVQTEKKDKTKYVEESKYLDLLTRFSKLEKKLEETRRMAEYPIVAGPGGSGVIGIPAPEPSPVGYVLTINDQKKAQWKAASGGTSISGYTITNPVTLKSIDLSDYTMDQLAAVVGTLLTELQA